MESYLMMLYVTLEQESALKNFFNDQGWMFCKPDLSVTTDKLGPSAVSGVQSKTSFVVYEENKGIETDQSNKQTFSGLQVETENISKIKECIKAGLQEGVHFKPDLLEVSGPTVKLETSDMSYNDDDVDNGDDFDEDTDVDYSYDEMESEIENAAKERRGEKSETVFDTTQEDDIEQYEAKGSHSKQYKGDDCNKGCDQKVILHQPSSNQVYTGLPNIYTCSYCEATFNVKSSKTRHVNSVHLGIRKNTCEECGDRFATSRLLDGHKRSKHYPETKFKCDICEKPFSFYYNLQAHVRICVRKNSKTCEICSENFESVENLDSHLLQKHSVDRKIVCEKCDKTFSSQKCLKSHMKFKHGNQSGYECEICGEKYLYPASLFNHKRQQGHFVAKEPGEL